MVQLLIVIGLFGLGLISIQNFWSGYEKKNREENLSYLLAKEQYEFAMALEDYIQDNIGKDIPSNVTYEKLIDEGYLSEYSYDGKSMNDGFDELGLTLAGRVSSPFGFSQSVTVVQEGVISEGVANYYGLLDNGDLNKTKLESVYRDAAEYILDMDKKYTGTIIISENGGDVIRSPFSDREEDVYEYLERSEFNNENEIMLSTFVNMEKEPGYWVLRYDLYYPSHRYGGPTGQYQNLRSLGYSSYCPEPGNSVPRDINVPGQLITLNPNGLGGLSLTGSWVTVGELLGFQYICLPATKIMVPDGEFDIDTSGSHQTHPRSELRCTNSYRKSLGYSDDRVYATTTANTFMIGDISYSLILKGMSLIRRCSATGSGSIYMSGNLFRGKLPSRVDIYEDNRYQDRINNVNQKTIILR